MSSLDWRYRPAKYVERHMIVEALHRLQAIAPLDQYRYVGFGSMYFVDFVLCHRVLGVTNMISIEKDYGRRQRYLFNRPFRTVDISFGRARDVLPQLEWEGRQIVWLDYDSQLTREVMSDVRYLVQRLMSASVLIVTINAQAPLDRRRMTLGENVGEDFVPPGLTEDALRPPWAFAEEQHRILSEAVDDATARRSDGTYQQQLFNFRYRDTVKMQTVGWILFTPKEAQAVNGCHFDSLEYVRNDESPYDLTVPKFTRRELEHLRQLVPTEQPTSLEWLDNNDFERYAELYRWYPEHVFGGMMG